MSDEKVRELADYLTEQFICGKKNVPSDECLVEAKYIIEQFFPAWAKEHGYKKVTPINEDDCITDGFGGYWSKTCPMCGEKTMHIVRPGDAQCNNCG